MFTSNVYDRILSEARINSRAAPDFKCKTYNDEVDISTIGPLLWSKDHFISNIRLPSLGSDEESDAGGDGLTRSFRDRGCTETKDRDLMQSTISSIEDFDCSQKRKRKSATVRMTANEVCQELSKANVSPHLLIAPHIYGESFGAGAGASQPFQITVHPQVGFLSDFHGHLCDAEVIGLLAGKWDAESKMLYVQAAFPCASTERREDDGSTDVELDPVAELAVREIISDLGLIVVGWYHSHPQFRPDPSVTDIHNQQQYQVLMKDDISGLEPFIGLIVSTFDVKLPTNESLHQWFHTRPYSDGSSRAKKVTAIPMLLDVQIGRFTDEHRDAEAFLTEERKHQLVDILQGLSNDSPKGVEGVVPEPTVSGIDTENNEINGFQERVKEDDDHYYDSDNSAQDCERPHVICTNSVPTYPVQRENNILADHSDKILYNFTASGGFEYLGESPADESEVLNVSTPEVKRKYSKKPAVLIAEGTERKSGRETRAPTMFVPEKEKKEKKEVITLLEDGVVSLLPSDSPLRSQVKAVKSSKNAAKKSGAQLKASSKIKGTSDVFPRAPKGLVGKYAGNLDKWLSAGAVEVPSPVCTSKAKKTKTQTKTKTSIKSKGTTKVVDLVPPTLPLPSEVESKEEVKRRHGPGARGIIKSTFLSFREKESDVPIESRIESSSSSSSSLLGKRKKDSNVEILSEKRKIKFKVKWPPEDETVNVKKSSGTVSSKKGKEKGKTEKLRGAVAEGSVCSSHADSGIQRKKKAHTVDEMDIKEEEEEVLTLLQRLQGYSPASVQGSALLCSVKPLYRCLIQGIVSLGFYYTTHPRKTRFSSVWREHTLKVDKLRESILHWAGKLCLSTTCQNTLVSNIVTFLLSCWAEGDEHVRKVQSVPKKKKLSIAAHDDLCAHTSKVGRSIIYKEDNGRDDVPKKKKKKKMSKI